MEEPSMSHQVRLTMIFGVLLLGLVGKLLFEEHFAAADSPEKKAPAPTTDSTDGKELFFVYSVNVVGEIDVCGCKRKKVRQGSITRRGSYLRQAQYVHPNMIVVDGGNALLGPDDKRTTAHELEQTLEKSKVLVEAYNRLGYGAMAVGNYDLLLGLENLKQLEEMAKFPFISANLADAETGELIFPPTAEVESGGVKVGLVGLTLETIPQYYLDKSSPNRKLKLTDALAAAEKYVSELRTRNDIVVVMSINDVNRNREIAEKVAGIDFLIDPLIELGQSQTLGRQGAASGEDRRNGDGTNRRPGCTTRYHRLHGVSQFTPLPRRC